MIGYGPESNHFVIELTYNYGVTSYDLGKFILNNVFINFLFKQFYFHSIGNDLNGISIKALLIV